MPSLFDDLARPLQRAPDETFGEFAPVIRSGHARIPICTVDADRMPQRAETLVEREQATSQVAAPRKMPRQAVLDHGWRVVRQLERRDSGDRRLDFLVYGERPIEDREPRVYASGRREVHAVGM
jgi:hypothetical protein